MEVLGHVDYKGMIAKYLDQDENGYYLKDIGWVNKNACKEVPAKKIPLIKPQTTFEDAVDEVLKDIGDTLKRKNHDYGNSFGELYKEYGDLSVLIRLSDKVNRLKTLIKTDAKVTEESLEDCYKDGGGYNILAMVYKKLEKQQLLG